jgi:hypothetical protein
VNLYRYVHNTPTNAKDSTGYDSVIETQYSTEWSGKKLTIHLRFINYTEKEANLITDQAAAVLKRVLIADADIKAVLNGTDTKHTRAHLCKWFTLGTPPLSNGDIKKIGAVFSGIVTGLTTETTVYKKINDPDNIAKASRGPFPGRTPTIKITPNNFFFGLTPQTQEAVHFHEFTHLFGGTDDLGYMKEKPFDTHYVDKDGHDVILDRSELIKNADTYTGYYREYYE